MHYTILSILLQGAKPDIIAIFLSLDEFPKSAKNLPLILKILESLKFVEFHFRPSNLKSFKKLIYALESFPNDNIITIDDDQFYDKDMILLLLRAHERHPRAICSHAIYNNDEFKALLGMSDAQNKGVQEGAQEGAQNKGARFDIYENLPTIFGIPLGVSGVLYPPRALHNDVFKTKIFMDICPMADDLWFWAMGVLNRTQKLLVPRALSHSYNWTVAVYESPHLYLSNVNENKNVEQMRNILSAYPEILSIIHES